MERHSNFRTVGLTATPEKKINLMMLLKISLFKMLRTLPKIVKKFQHLKMKRNVNDLWAAGAGDRTKLMTRTHGPAKF